MTRKTGLNPDEVRISRDRHELRLIWSDGRDAALTALALRSACRCAWCTRDRILDRFSIESGAVALAEVEALGSHGLHIKFSDGHARGIFPWAYLDELTRDASAATRVVTTGTDKH